MTNYRNFNYRGLDWVFTQLCDQYTRGYNNTDVMQLSIDRASAALAHLAAGSNCLSRQTSQ